MSQIPYNLNIYQSTNQSINQSNSQSIGFSYSLGSCETASLTWGRTLCGVYIQ